MKRSNRLLKKVYLSHPELDLMKEVRVMNRIILLVFVVIISFGFILNVWGGRVLCEHGLRA